MTRKTIGLTKIKSERTCVVGSIFAENYLEYQYRFVEFLVEHLSDLSRTFRGDLQQMIVLAVIGQMELQGVRHATLAGENRDALPPHSSGIAASRIADVTAIPRGTVRRKLELLETRGWIERNNVGTWRLRRHADVLRVYVDLNDLDRRSMERMARVFVDLESLVTTKTESKKGPL